MAVLVTLSNTVSGLELSDPLAGDILAVGADLGSVQNNSYSPLGNKALNTGAYPIFIRHDAVFDPIIDCGWYLQPYNTTIPWTYGGARNPIIDMAAIFSLGDASGSSKNNADGLSGGIWIDQRWDASTVQQFDNALSNVEVFRTLVGDALPTRIPTHANSMVFSNGGTPIAATAPITGTIGKNLNTTFGDRSYSKWRIQIPATYAEGGYYQWESVFAYTYTA